MFAQVLLFALLPMAVLVLTGLVAVFRTPGPRLRSALQHFAAGVIFEAAAVEVLPEVRRAQSAFPIIGFVLGAGLVLTVSQLGRRAERTEQEGKASPVGLLTVVGIDVLIDGLLIGISFVGGAKVGVLLTLALTTELLFLGLYFGLNPCGNGPLAPARPGWKYVAGSPRARGSGIWRSGEDHCARCPLGRCALLRRGGAPVSGDGRVAGGGT